MRSAAALARGPELDRAEQLIRAGLDELPAGQQFALDRIFCLLRGSEVSRHNGNAQDGIARVEAAQQLLQQIPFDSVVLQLRVFMDLGEAYRIAGTPSGSERSVPGSSGSPGLGRA